MSHSATQRYGFVWLNVGFSVAAPIMFDGNSATTISEEPAKSVRVRPSLRGVMALLAQSHQIHESPAGGES